MSIRLSRSGRRPSTRAAKTRRRRIACPSTWSGARTTPQLIQVIDSALARGLPANVEERLRKRRERCSAHSSGRKAADVPSYSERHGAGAFSCRFQGA